MLYCLLEEQARVKNTESKYMCRCTSGKTSSGHRNMAITRPKSWLTQVKATCGGLEVAAEVSCGHSRNGVCKDMMRVGPGTS